MGVMSTRWMIRRDLPEVMEVEFRTENYLSTDGLLSLLSNRDHIGRVTEYSEMGKRLVVGFSVHQLFRDHYDLLHLAVHPEWQRKGIGSSMVKYMTDKLMPGRRTYVNIDVRESNLAAQLFLKKLGFQCTNIVPGYYEDEWVPGEPQIEDAYQFVYKMEKKDGDIQRSELPGQSDRIDSASAG
jgi:ribosomal-protein-alanine N-acetyltransferase